MPPPDDDGGRGCAEAEVEGGCLLCPWPEPDELDDDAGLERCEEEEEEGGGSGGGRVVAAVKPSPPPPDFMRVCVWARARMVVVGGLVLLAVALPPAVRGRVSEEEGGRLVAALFFLGGGGMVDDDNGFPVSAAAGEGADRLSLALNALPRPALMADSGLDARPEEVADAVDTERAMFVEEAEDVDVGFSLVGDAIRDARAALGLTSLPFLSRPPVGLRTGLVRARPDVVEDI